MTETDVRRAGPGRPPTTDAGAIALVAVRLFLERGYDRVTMAEVAAAAGVGRSTLFRYFPTKGSLLWYQHDVHDAEFRRELAAAPEASLVDAVFGSYARFMAGHAHEWTLAKAINAVIVTEAPSSTGKWDAFDEWAGFIAELAAARRGGSPSDMENREIGLVLWSAVWSAVEAWATSEDDELAPYLERARVGVSRLVQGG